MTDSVDQSVACLWGGLLKLSVTQDGSKTYVEVSCSAVWYVAMYISREILLSFFCILLFMNPL